MEVLLLGVATSIFAELVTWANKKLTGTIFANDGAFLIVLVLSLLVGAFKVFNSGISVATPHDIGIAFLQVFAVSQIWFKTIANWFNLKVPEPSPTQPIA